MVSAITHTPASGPAPLATTPVMTPLAADGAFWPWMVACIRTRPITATPSSALAPNPTFDRILSSCSLISDALPGQIHESAYGAFGACSRPGLFSMPSSEFQLFS